MGLLLGRGPNRTGILKPGLTILGDPLRADPYLAIFRTTTRMLLYYFIISSQSLHPPSDSFQVRAIAAMADLLSFPHLLWCPIVSKIQNPPFNASLPGDELAMFVSVPRESVDFRNCCKTRTPCVPPKMHDPQDAWESEGPGNGYPFFKSPWFRWSIPPF